MQINDDIASDRAVNNPTEYYRQIREHDPIHQSDMWGGWIITKYDDVRALLRDNQHLSVEVDFGKTKQVEMPATSQFVSQWLVFRDPPEHTQLRGLIAGAITERSVQEYRDDIEEIAQSLITEIRDSDNSEIDFISQFAFRLPAHVICEILGIPPEDRHALKQWSEDITPTVQLFYGEEDRHGRTEKSIREFSEYLQNQIEQRRRDPRDDLITDLIQAEKEGQMLDDEEIVAISMFLLIAGHETTTKLLTNAVLELSRHPEQRVKILEDESLVPKAVEEILRYRPPVKGVTRSVIEDFEYNGNQFKSGERLLLGLASANRDPEKFEKPNTFDITRGSDEHMAFGEGIHTCIGAPLARLEAQVALPLFLEAFPDAKVITKDLEWRGSVVHRTLEELRLDI